MSPKFGFCGPAYESQSLTADAQAVINWYYEPDETGKGNSEGFLYPSPGEKLFVDLGASPSMALIFDHGGGSSGHTNTPFTAGTSSVDGEVIFGVVTLDATFAGTPDPGAGWTRIALTGTNTQFIGLFVTYKAIAGFVSFTCPIGAVVEWSTCLLFFKAVPGPITLASLVQEKLIASGTLTGAPLTTIGSFDANVTAGNTILVLLTYSNLGSGFFGTVSISDNRGNSYSVLRVEDTNNGVNWWYAVNVAGGPTTITVVTNPGSVAGCFMDILEIKTT